MASKTGECPLRREVLTRRQVAEVIGVSPSTLDRMVGRGEFPPPLRLSPGRVGWRRTTVQRWLAEREAASVRRVPDVPPSPRHPAERRVPQ